MVDVYADLLFAVNFCMDYACLLMTARVLGVSFIRWRLVLAAALGGIYSVAALFVAQGVFSFVLAIISLILICLVAFYRPKDGFSRMAKLTLTDLGMNAVVGGAVSALFELMGNLADICFPDVEYEKATDLQKALFLSLGIGCAAAYFLITRIKSARLDRISKIRIKVNDRELYIDAFCDSGNLLKDPFSGKPCTVISEADFLLLSKNMSSSELLLHKGENDNGDMRVVLIPTRTVNSSSLMLGFYPDSAELTDRDGHILKSFDTVVAVSTEKSLKRGCAVLPSSVV